MDLLITIFIIVLTVYLTNLYYTLSYWKRKHIPYKLSLPFLGSVYKECLGFKTFVDAVINDYNEFSNQRYFGIHWFKSPALVIRDRELIKKISVKDFDHFADHQEFFNFDLDPFLGNSLIFLRGQKWKDMRSKLSPVFTSSKLKGMFGFMTNCAEQFTNYLLSQKEDVISCEMKECFTKFANDVIANAAFGIDCDSFKNPDNDFYAMGKLSNFGSFTQSIKMVLSNIIPKVLIWLDMPMVSRKFSSFFKEIIINNMRQREQENIHRPDLVHLLMEMKKGKLKYDEEKDTDMGFATVEESNIGKRDVDMEITDDLLVSQAILFFLGGFDSIATAMSFCIYELALNTDVQERLQKEIDDVLGRKKGKVTYEDVASMKYLDMVISESLRKWPNSLQIDRQCTKNYVIEPEGFEDTLLVEKGNIIQIPVIAIHRDPKYYPNPEKFNPERFSDENKDKILPYSYLPFGMGPRNCIGSRFALLEAKVLLIYLLSKFSVVVTDKTRIPIQVAKGPILGIKGGCWLGFKKR